MSRHLPRGFLTPGLDPFNRGRQPSGSVTRIFGQQPQATSGGLDDFRFAFEGPRPNQPTYVRDPEFSNTGLRRRLRPESFDESRERQGQNLFQNFGAIARGEEGFTRRVDPVTGQPIDQGAVGFGRYGPIPYQRIPSFNIEATKVDVSGAQRANSQAFSAQRQAAARGAIGTFGNRLGARSGGAGLAAINQSAAPLFAAQTSANASLQAGAAFTDQASQQAADVFNVNTRKFGVTGQQDMLSQFRAEAGQRAGIEQGQDSLRLGREELRVNKEGQDLRAALEKKRLGILSFNAGEQAIMNKFNRWLAEARLNFDIDKFNKENSTNISWGDVFEVAARIGAAWATGGTSEVVYQGGNAASGGFDAPLFGGG